MRIQTPKEILNTIDQLTAGDSVRVVYEIEGDWAVAICQYDSHRQGEHTRLVKFRLYNQSMTLGVNEIVELERRAS